jgi:hypothetical protein
MFLKRSRSVWLRVSATRFLDDIRRLAEFQLQEFEWEAYLLAGRILAGTLPIVAEDTPELGW